MDSDKRDLGRGRSVPSAITTLCIAALVFAAIGCGGDDDSQAERQDAQAPDGKPIKVLTYADISVQPPAPSGEFASNSVKAAIDRANAEGGINGRPIDLIVCDSKFDPNGAAECGRQAVEENVVAVVGGVSPFDAQLGTVVQEAGIPMIGSLALSPEVFNGDLAFCHTAQTSTTLSLFGEVARQAGLRKLSLIIIGGTPLEERNIEAFERGIEEAGLEKGSIVTPDASTTNFAPAATEAAADEADGVVVLPLSQTASIAQQIQQQEPELEILLPSFVFSFGDEWPSSLNGIVVLAAAQPPTTTGVAGIEEYRADMEQFAPDTALSETSVYQWLAGDWFVRAVGEIDGEITAESVVKEFNSLEDFDMKGIVPPYDSDRRGEVAPEACAVNDTVVRAELQDNELVAVDPGEFIAQD